MWQVPETTLRVAAQAGHVAVDEHEIARVAEMISAGELEIPPWGAEHHYFDGTAATVAYFTVLDTVNFCFWPPPGKRRWGIRVGNSFLSGYVGMASALRAAMEKGVPLTSAQYLSGMNAAEFSRIIGGSGMLPLIEERAAALRELGGLLLAEYRGEARLLVKEACGSAVGLALILAEKLASFRDKAFYRGGTVWFLKRAQILAADLYGAFGGQSWGAFSDIDQLTAFADYKVPQVLRQQGILRYSPALASRVDLMVPIPAGSDMEVELRAATIAAVERLRYLLVQRGKAFRSHELDWMFWSMGQDDRFRKKPYHRTLTVFY
ncbi:MAG TPA: hypothetical protein ENN79_06775 [Desulfobacteraceae bacterium]|nr:hypothetical protein [Desulfobacteraceae bacterium]